AQPAATGLGPHGIAHPPGADGKSGVWGDEPWSHPDEGLYPVVEINARNNMSTYQAVVHEVLAGPDDVAVARHFPLRLHRPLPFTELRELLGPSLLTQPGARPYGLFVNNYATVNAAAAEDAGAGSGGFEGRLYGVLLAGSDERIEALATDITRRLAALTERS
ncbi:hypothetical protein ACFVY4_14360, partial [Streptomyces sp. NPDC058299]